MITTPQRQTFDLLLEEVIDELPEHLASLLEEVPVVVEDRPSRKVMEEMKLDPTVKYLCGLYSGFAMTHRSVELSGVLLDHITLFREGIIRLAGSGRSAARRFGVLREGAKHSAMEDLKAEIRVTLLHEMGHHFGLDEDDLAEVGFD
ncbi:MAG: metallopeptidase family protein [Phycisphaeraceae bacterium]